MLRRQRLSPDLQPSFHVKTVCDWLICCDGTTATGLGHVGRCLGYAERLAEAGHPCVFQGHFDDTARRLITEAGFAILHAPCLKERKTTGPEPASSRAGVLVDSYDFDAPAMTAWHQRLGSEGKRLVVLDDFGSLPRYDCEALINFTIGAVELAYPEGPARRYLGPRFYPARRWLRDVRRERQARHSGGEALRNILIAAGGSDHTGVTPALVEALATFRTDCEVVVLSGNGVAHEERVRAGLERFRTARFLGPQPHLGPWMKWADACLCGGGLIKYECLYAGLPAAAVSQTPGQAGDSALLARGGLILDLGFPPEVAEAGGRDRLRDFLENPAGRAARRDRGLRALGHEDEEAVLVPFLDTTTKPL